MKEITIRLQFDGLAKVLVPDHLSEVNATLLAERLALAQVLATFENPDCGECLEVACEEYEEELRKRCQMDAQTAEEDFDTSKCNSLSGDWVSAAYYPSVDQRKKY